MKKRDEPGIGRAVPDSPSERSQSNARVPKMMLAFVIRRCAVEIGHAPSAAEFAAWANGLNGYRRRRSVFGRPISELEARIILRHQSRLVSAKSATPKEAYVAPDAQTAARRTDNVLALDKERTRRGLGRKPRRTRRPRRS